MRSGVELKANRRAVPFSIWPVATNNVHRSPVQSLLFAIDPWLIMKRSIAEQIDDQDTENEALSYIDQASDFYKSALQSQLDAAKPVQLYYSYLNIVKAFILCRGNQQTMPKIRHGISESIPQGGDEFTDAYIEIWKSPDSQMRLQAFDEFLQALNCPQFPNGYKIPIIDLVPQILPGHRLWAAATGEKERFLSLQRVQFTQNANSKRKRLWLRLYLYRDDLPRLGHTQKDVLDHSLAGRDFHIVKCTESIDNRELICFEQTRSVPYNRHGVDLAASLSERIRNRLWVTVASNSPYRRYYLYICPPFSQSYLLPQLASIYALTFYLGSVTRYRPTVFQSLLKDAYGPRIGEFISGQPAQFIYLMASEFAKRDVTQPAIV